MGKKQGGRELATKGLKKGLERKKKKINKVNKKKKESRVMTMVRSGIEIEMDEGKKGRET